MASGSGVLSYHSTLVASTVDTVTLNRPWEWVEVINRGTGDVFVTLGSVLPTVEGADTYVVPSNSTKLLKVRPETQNPINGSAPRTTAMVNLISTGTPAYSVVGQ